MKLFTKGTFEVSFVAYPVLLLDKWFPDIDDVSSVTNASEAALLFLYTPQTW